MTTKIALDSGKSGAVARFEIITRAGLRQEFVRFGEVKEISVDVRGQPSVTLAVQADGAWCADTPDQNGKVFAFLNPVVS
ncbi:hypothetical protein DMH04_26680 [Kibdelosporangium aridum]|uniref:Uncharacterized protein n=1 Tax=Kibdelosporangium aridum TaxID=2030 RepID=A0A428Z547_KIBAR|nr:hypothetical protein [Kibdelosporangium aridum]RSM81934.1 hypothetical protein DMH04_26680 [Kibdelosporangium aridum]